MLLLKIYVAEQREIMQTSSCVPPHTHTHTYTHTVASSSPYWEVL